SCVAMATTNTANVSTAPTTDGIGIEAPRIWTESGTRNGRRSSGCETRSQTTASCAAVKANSAPKEKRLARNATGDERNEVITTIAIETRGADRIDGGAAGVRRFRRPKAGGSCPCSPREYASRPNPEIDVVVETSRISAAVNPTYRRSAVWLQSGMWPLSAATIPRTGEYCHVVPSAVVPFSGGKAESATSAIRT